MLRIQMSVIVGVVLFMNMLAPAGLVLQLDSTGQNLSGSQNVGTSWNPIDTGGIIAPVTMTARSSIDSNFPLNLHATGSIGTIFFAGEGTGVQNATGGGSKEISGGGGHQNEELIFNFHNLVLASTITLGFTQYDSGLTIGSGSGDDDDDDDDDDDEGGNGGGNDDTVIFVVLSTGVELTFDEVAFAPAFTSTGNMQGTVDFAQLGFGFNDLVDQVIVRETRSHMLVNELGFSVIPAPGGLALLGLTGLMSSRRRRRYPAIRD